MQECKTFFTSGDMFRTEKMHFGEENLHNNFTMVDLVERAIFAAHNVLYMSEIRQINKIGLPIKYVFAHITRLLHCVKGMNIVDWRLFQPKRHCHSNVPIPKSR